MSHSFDRALAFTIAVATLIAAGNALAQSWPEELAKYFRYEIDKYAKVIKAGNIQVE